MTKKKLEDKHYSPFIGERESMPDTLDELNVYEKGQFFECFVDAIGRKAPIGCNEMQNCYAKLPPNIKQDILTLSIFNEEVKVKLTNWIRENKH